MTSRLPDAFDFAQLTNGRCHYRIGGPADGPPPLLLHGVTVPGWAFDRIVPFLNAAGFRTICPDFCGHGYSDRPRARYDHDLFVRQAAELVDRVSPGLPVEVFGRSLGATIGARLWHGWQWTCFPGRRNRAGSLTLAYWLTSHEKLRPVVHLPVNPSARLTRIPSRTG